MTTRRPIVLLAFDHDRLQSTLEFISKHRLKVTLLVGNGNVISPSSSPLISAIAEAIIEGTNNLWEWSGYNEGLNAVRTDKNSIESVLFMNDTAFKHKETEKILSAYLGGNDITPRLPTTYILGRYHRPSRALTFELNSNFSGWISTFCFALTKDLFPLVNEVCLYLSHFTVDNRREGVTLLDTFFDELHPTMVAHLNWWLFGGGWYRSEPLSNANYVMFRQKLRSILGEFKLTQLCRNRTQIITV